MDLIKKAIAALPPPARREAERWRQYEDAKQPISLMDGTERNPQEKKLSVLKKLKEQPPQSASERKPRKTKEKEI